MPPIARFTREDVLNAASTLVRREGPSALNARALAREMNCSTQPIFRLFTGMDELNNAVRQKANDLFFGELHRKMAASATPFITMCLHYLNYAQQEPELFKLLFMCDRVSDGSYEREQAAYSALFRILAESMRITPAHAEALYARVWVYTHGLAVAMVTKYVPPMSEEELTRRMTEACSAAADKLGLELPEL